MKKRMAFLIGFGLVLPWACARPVLVIGHRGSPEAFPENTLPSFQAAIHAGADWVELDSRISADGSAFCLHDKTLDRTTNARALFGGEGTRLGQVSDAMVEKVDAGSWFAPRFAGTRVPHLGDALVAIQEEATTLLERKDGAAEYYAKLLQNKGLVGKLVVQSFDWEFLTDLHDLLPDQPLCALGSKPLDPTRWEKLERTGASRVAWAHQDLNRDVIARFHDEGLGVLAYTVDKEGDWRRLIRGGVDGIITNRPGALRRWLGGRNAPDPFRTAGQGRLDN